MTCGGRYLPEGAAAIEAAHPMERWAIPLGNSEHQRLKGKAVTAGCGNMDCCCCCCCCWAVVVDCRSTTSHFSNEVNKEVLSQDAVEDALLRLGLGLLAAFGCFVCSVFFLELCCFLLFWWCFVVFCVRQKIPPFDDGVPGDRCTSKKRKDGKEPLSPLPSSKGSKTKRDD